MSNINTHPLFRTWCNIRQRCNNPARPDFKWYGGRGIQVCRRWQQFSHFVMDMESTYKRGLWLDRRNPDGPYSKINCRWVTPHIQQINRRVRATNKSGIKGVFVRQNANSVTYRTGIMHSGKWVWLGSFKYLYSALKRRKSAERMAYAFN